MSTLILIISILFSTFLPTSAAADAVYSYNEYPLEWNGIALHLDCVTEEGKVPDKSILLIHGVTYSSFAFDIDYEDYSLVRKLASEGYAVWRLDIAGFGRSEMLRTVSSQIQIMLLRISMPQLK